MRLWTWVSAKIGTRISQVRYRTGYCFANLSSVPRSKESWIGMQWEKGVIGYQSVRQWKEECIAHFGLREEWITVRQKQMSDDIGPAQLILFSPECPKNLAFFCMQLARFKAEGANQWRQWRQMIKQGMDPAKALIFACVSLGSPKRVVILPMEGHTPLPRAVYNDQGLRAFLRNINNPRHWDKQYKIKEGVGLKAGGYMSSGITGLVNPGGMHCNNGRYILFNVSMQPTLTPRQWERAIKLLSERIDQPELAREGVKHVS